MFACRLSLVSSKYDCCIRSALVNPREKWTPTKWSETWSTEYMSPEALRRLLTELRARAHDAHRQHEESEGGERNLLAMVPGAFQRSLPELGSSIHGWLMYLLCVCACFIKKKISTLITLYVATEKRHYMLLTLSNTPYEVYQLYPTTVTSHTCVFVCLTPSLMSFYLSVYLFCCSDHFMLDGLT